MKASDWVGRVSEQAYETDDYIYRHVHLPRHCKLGEQWEHYGWHGPEPHIILFRRPKHPARQEARPRPARQEACPRPLDNTRIQQLEKSLQDFQDKLRDSQVQEQACQNRIKQLQSELQTSQDKAKEQAHQNEVLSRTLRQQACQHEAEAVGSRRSFQKQAEQLLFTSDAALPWDERMAARGLSPKLHWWQIPEITAFVALCEDVLAHFAEAERAPTIMGIITLLARGVRGVQGLSVVREAVVSPIGLKALSSEACPQDVLRNLSMLVLRQARQTARGRRMKRKLSFLGHREGRHAMYSGKHFLVAAMTKIGTRGAAAVIDKLTPVMEHILKHGSSKGLSGPILSQLLDVARGRMVLAITAGRKNRKTVWKASGYNSMDFARWVVLWGLASGRVQSSVLEEKSFAQVRKCQSTLSRQEADRAGIHNASQLALKVAALQTVAMAATDMPLVGGMSPPLVGGMSPPRTSSMLSWPTTWAHFCELGRVRQDFDSSTLEGLMNSRFSDLQEAVADEVQRLAKSPEHVKDCHAVRVVSAAIAARTQKPKTARPTARLRKKTPVRIANKARVEIVSLGAGDSRRERIHKSVVICNLCGKEVRKDNLSRHRASGYCQNRSRA